jgi:hypothetical protein
VRQTATTRATTYYSLTRVDPVSGVSTTYKIPTLDLTTNPVTVYYDKNVATWPASYVSIFYPQRIQMDDSTGTMHRQRDRASHVGCPGQRTRIGKLTQKLNLHGTDGSTAWPLSSNPLHPEDQGAANALTDDERKTIAVYPMDLGGQYYARQNTGFAPIPAAMDAVSPN